MLFVMLVGAKASVPLWMMNGTSDLVIVRQLPFRLCDCACLTVCLYFLLLLINFQLLRLAGTDAGLPR